MNLDNLYNTGGKLLVNTAIKADDIVVQIDSNNEEGDNGQFNLKRQYGSTYPLIKLNDKSDDEENPDYVCPPEAISNLDVSINLYSIPSFSFVLNDTDYKIRDKLRNDIDKCTLFIGSNNLYIKFNGLITTTQDMQDSVFCSGVMYIEDLYKTEQKLYKDKSIKEILTEICTELKMGLFLFDNVELSDKIDIVINPGLRIIDFIGWLIRNYTDCLWCIDTWGILHITNTKTIYAQDFDKFYYDCSRRNITPDGEYKEFDDGPKDVTFTNHAMDYKSLEDESEEYWKLFITNLSISNVYSATKINTYGEYQLRFDTDDTKEIETNTEIGTGKKQINTFYPWTDHKKPFNSTRIYKASLNVNIQFEMSSNPFFEILPFTVCDMEIYKLSSMEATAASSDSDFKIEKNEEHSGKRVISGYQFIYDKNMASSLVGGNEGGIGSNRIRQIIKLL